MELNYLKTFTVFLMGLPAMIIGFYNPIGATLLAVALAFLFDLLMGVIKSKILKQAKVSREGGKRALALFAVYIFLIVFLFTLGKLMKDQFFTQDIVIIVSVVTIWFYVVNGFKNLSILFPQSKMLRFFVWVLNVEFVEKIGFLKRFLASEEDKKQKRKYTKRVKEESNDDKKMLL